MLSRVANSLFWFGRYIERVEHTARYAKVQYFSSLDAPLAQKMDFVLESILNMSGKLEEFTKSKIKFNEDEVLNYVTLNDKNPSSVYNSIVCARENARGARDTISSELWESVNKYYHFVYNTDKSKFDEIGHYEFYEKVLEYSAVVKGYIDNTLFHNEAWHLISIGLHIERAIQITQIITTKLNDVSKLEKIKASEIMINYQWSTLLKCAEGFDMSRKLYRALPNKANTLEFLILNSTFPKSLTFNLTEAYKNLQYLSRIKVETIESMEFMLGKLSSEYKYKTIKEIEPIVQSFLYETLNRVYKTAERLENEYLS